MSIKNLIMVITIVFVFSMNGQNNKNVLYANYIKSNTLIEDAYKELDNINSIPIPSLKSFKLAFDGFEYLKNNSIIEKSILTIIDFSISSNKKRLWIVDMDSYKILYHTLVSHGKNSGDEYAENFSNIEGSEKSSLGFYATGETYIGKNGYSLKIDGLSGELNSNARSRSVVIHAADYVSNEFVYKNGKLGRSQGCPALPKELNQEIIDLIKNKSCLFIYHPKLDSKYEDSSFEF